MSMHWLTGLIYSDDPKRKEQGRKELAAAIKGAKTLPQAAKNVGVPARTLQRWLKLAGLPTPDGRYSSVSTEEIQAAYDKYGTAAAAARAVRLTRTGVVRRLGLEPKKPAKSKARKTFVSR